MQGKDNHITKFVMHLQNVCVFPVLILVDTSGRRKKLLNLPSRACNSPAPGPGGDSCQGGDREELECGTELCGEYQRTESGQCQKVFCQHMSTARCVPGIVKV